MKARCQLCGEHELVAVLFPDHEEVQAIICLRCGQLQQVQESPPRAAGA